ncbi:hypothetical protein [Kribbella endophytica]
MDGSGSLQRLVARGLMLVAALVAVCAFHSSSEPSEQPTAAVAAAVELVGPLHVDLADVPGTSPSDEGHAHLAVAWLVGLSVSLLLLGLVARVRRVVAVRSQRDSMDAGWGFGPPEPPWPATPSLIQLRISRT